jgi:apolipoprotein N-acyltransferase
MSTAAPRAPLAPRLGLAVLSAALLFASIPPLGLSSLALVALTPLLVALSLSTPREGLRLGFLFGLLSSAANAYWFLFVFGGDGTGLVVSSILWGILALFPAAYGVLHPLLAQKGPLSLLLFAPALWLSIDWIRSEGTWLRFAWFTLGYALSGNPCFRQDADLAGVYGLTLLSFLVSLLLERAFAFRRDGRGVILLMFAVALPATAYARGNRALGFAPPVNAGEENGLRVVAVQDERPGSLEPKRRVTLEAIAREPGPPDVVLWPELAAGELDDRARPSLRSDLAAIARRVKGAFVFGALRSLPGRKEGRGATHVNVAVLLGPGGEEIGEYRKRVPVQFLEGAIAPGTSAGVFQIAGARVGVFVCYDGTYPFVTRELVQEGAEVLLTPSLDLEGWGAIQHAHHSQFYPLRACELRRPIVRAASSGTSMALDAWGRELARVDPFAPGALAATVYPRSTMTLYVRGGWLLPFVAMAVVLGRGVVGMVASARNTRRARSRTMGSSS